MADWGYTGTGDSDTNLTDHIRQASGQFTVAGQKLDSVTVRGGGAGGSGRLGVYTNTINDIDGATLVEDLGVVTIPSGSTVTANSATNPTLTQNNYYFLCVKGTNGSCNTRKLTGTFTGSDFAQYWEGNAAMSTDETVAYPATAGAESFTATEALCIYMTYSSASTSTPVIFEFAVG